MQEEKATLSQFDTELKELDRLIKEKKAFVADADLKIQNLQHDIQNLTKEKTTALNHLTRLEQSDPWILEESECVLQKLSDPKF